MERACYPNYIGVVKVYVFLGLVAIDCPVSACYVGSYQSDPAYPEALPSKY